MANLGNKQSDTKQNTNIKKDEHLAGIAMERRTLTQIASPPIPPSPKIANRGMMVQPPAPQPQPPPAPSNHRIDPDRLAEETERALSKITDDLLDLDEGIDKKFDDADASLHNDPNMLQPADDFPSANIPVAEDQIQRSIAAQRELTPAEQIKIRRAIEERQRATAALVHQHKAVPVVMATSAHGATSPSFIRSTEHVATHDEFYRHYHIEEPSRSEPKPSKSGLDNKLEPAAA